MNEHELDRTDYKDLFKVVPNTKAKFNLPPQNEKYIPLPYEIKDEDFIPLFDRKDNHEKQKEN